MYKKKNKKREMKKQLPVKTYENQKRNIKHEELRKPKLRIIF